MNVEIFTEADIRRFIREEIARATPAPQTYSQLDGQRPAGAGRVKYLRAWHALVAAGDTGAWAEGRARLMTAEAWARFISAPIEIDLRPPPRDLAAEVLRELGAVRTAH
jgi:hypothetical protein